MGVGKLNFRSGPVVGLDCWGFAVELFELIEVDSLDIATDAALGEGERHPWFKMMDDSRLYLGVLIEVVVEAVGEGVHQGLQPCGAGGVLGLQDGGVDEELHAEVEVYFG